MDEAAADILVSIEQRELLIARLRQIVELSTQLAGKQLAVVARELANISTDLREVSIRLVQKIITWTFLATAPEASAPSRFLWNNNEEYLCKMLHDVDFVQEKLPDRLKNHGHFSAGDPCFMFKHTGELNSRREAAGATLVILDAVARQTSQNKSVASISRRSHSQLLKTQSKEDRDHSPNGSGASLGSNGLNVSRRSAQHNILEKAEEKRPVHNVVDRHDSDGKRKFEKRHGGQVEIFRGKYLYRRGSLLGEGAYAKVLDSLYLI
jgi:hypothetical protein